MVVEKKKSRTSILNKMDDSRENPEDLTKDEVKEISDKEFDESR